jgi:hypothetical protein
MSGKTYIQTKQMLWAKRNSVFLKKPTVDSGEANYTQKIEDNLYEALDTNYTKMFEAADGGELVDKANSAAKMKALHSSSAIGVNFFHYWGKRDLVKAITHACKLCGKENQKTFDLTFEEKFQIDSSFQRSPNIDVVIRSRESKPVVFGIECKFSEAYGGSHGGLSEKYIEKGNLWTDIPNLYEFAKSISPKDKRFKKLHPAQLIKHILGLKKQCGGKSFKLLYLWYAVPSEDGFLHRKEIEEFTEIAKKDKIKFQSITYQEVIVNLYKHYYQEYSQLIDYLADRYL